MNSGNVPHYKCEEFKPSYIEMAREKVAKGSFYLSHHAQMERGEERVRVDDIVAATSNGRELESYPDDPI